MNSLTSIVAVGLDGAIGIENRLPWRLKSDLRFFQRTTKNNVIIMGRKTYDSLGRCLPLRENVVMSHTPSLFPPHEGCHHVHSISEALSLRTKWPKKHAYVIGGAQTYAQFAPLVDRYLLTIVSSHFPSADAFFDQSLFGKEDLWEKTAVPVDLIDENGVDEFSFQVFELKLKQPEIARERRRKLVEQHKQKNHLLKSKSHARAQSLKAEAVTRSLFA